jgi:large subunit ribosomal protein L25
MSEVQNLSAELRSRAGKGAARQSRRDGRVPGVIYGDKKPPTLISVAPRELMKELRKKAFHVTLFDIAVDGRKERVLPRDVQFDPVGDQPIHVDFMRVGEHTRVHVAVPVSFRNEATSPGLKRGGVLNIVRHTIEVECLATQIPSEIRIDLAGTDIGHSVHISSVVLPEGVRPTITVRDFTIATVAPPTILAVETEAAPAATVETEVITAKGEAKEGEEEGGAKGKEPAKGGKEPAAKGKEPAKGKEGKG